MPTDGARQSPQLGVLVRRHLPCTQSRHHAQRQQGAHGVVVCEGAGWHHPRHTTLLLLPPYVPQLNPIENAWDYLRRNKLSKCVRDTLRGNRHEAIVVACSEAWMLLVKDLERVDSIAHRSCACVTSRCNMTNGGKRQLIQISGFLTRQPNSTIEGANVSRIACVSVCSCALPRARRRLSRRTARQRCAFATYGSWIITTPIGKLGKQSGN